ncbi:MAG: hypothetical protein ABIG93_05465 [archaeon]|nr:hypothetical protein [Nanoarchaeota archaeon]
MANDDYSPAMLGAMLGLPVSLSVYFICAFTNNDYIAGNTMLAFVGSAASGAAVMYALDKVFMPRPEEDVRELGENIRHHVEDNDD